MTVIEYKPEHLEKIKVKDVHSGEVPTTIMQRALTIMDGEQPIAIFGSFIFVPGVVHFWGLVSDDVRKKPKEFHKIVRNFLNYYMRSCKPRRIQVDVRADYEEGHKWAESLGFCREGLMKNYGVNGEDFYLYGRTA